MEKREDGQVKMLHESLFFRVRVSVLCGHGKLSCAEDVVRSNVFRAMSMRWHGAFGIGGFMSSWRPQ